MDRIIRQVFEGKSVGIYPEFMVNSALRRSICTVRPNLMRQIHTSKESMTPGTLHPIFSNRIPRPMLEWLDYQAETSLEFDLFNLIMDYSIDLLATDNGIPRTPAYYKCMEHIVDESTPLKQFMTLYDIKPANRVILVLLAVASIVLGIEMAYSKLPKSTCRASNRSTANTLKQRQLMKKVVIERLVVVKKVANSAKIVQVVDVKKGDRSLGK